MGEPPCTPSLSQVVPNFSLSKAIEVACPPQTDLRSMTVTLNLCGCWAKVAAHDYDFGLSVPASVVRGGLKNHSRSSSADNHNVLHNFTLGIFFCRFSLFMQSSGFGRWVNVVGRHGAHTTKLQRRRYILYGSGLLRRLYTEESRRRKLAETQAK